MLEDVGLLLHIGVMLVFLVIVVNSKHLHIFTAPLNVMFSRRPDGLGAAQPMRIDGKLVDFEDEDLDPERLGRGKIEDTTWKGFLDFSTCTECGRCQSQCPAWNTDKPLSPKMLIMDLRDHAFAKAPVPAGRSRRSERDDLHAEDVLGAAGRSRWSARTGVIHPDVLWSCTNCGACVEQCPVDIEHIDHILDMRRYQVMIESSFPSEAGVMLKNLENKGNPWGMSEMKRADWIEELDFEVDASSTTKMPEDVEYLFWVGCAGALEDRAKKTTKAVAELLHIAGVKFAVLGPMETCTGDPARRLGMEFLFHMLAQQNVETLNEAGRQEDRRHLPALLQHPRQRVPAARRQLRGRPPHPAAGQPGRRGQAHPGHPDRGEDHLPRPVLPGPPQQGLHPAARHHGQGARACRPRRCTGTRTAASAAAPAARGCGWRSGSASASTPSASTRR